MSSKIYLKGIALSEFRTFKRIDIPLDPGPGVFIVSGSNGLGKSSLFDAIEWALSGTVSRFEKDKRKNTQSDYLTKWGSENKTEVSLSFSDEITVKRDLEGVQLNTPSEMSIANYLRSDSWKAEIQGLERYLMLTHFLGQSTLSRMTHRDETERWSFLQGPAQSDYAVAISSLLHGHGGSAIAKEFERQSDDLIAKAGVLETYLTSEQAQSVALHVEGIMDESSARQATNQIADEVNGFARQNALKSELSISGPIPEALSNVTNQLQNFERNFKSRISTANSALTIVDERDRIYGLQAQILEQLETLAQSDEKLNIELELLTKEATAVTDNTKIAEDELRKLEARSAALGELSKLFNEKQIRNSELVTYRAQIGETELKLNVANVKVEKAQRVINIAKKIESQIIALEKAWNVVSLRRNLISKFTTLNNTLAVLRRRLAESVLDYPDITEQVLTAEENLKAVSSNRQDLEHRLASLKNQTNRMAAAVSSVAALISEADCICPVCDSTFSSETILLDQATKAAERLNPIVASAELALKSANLLEEQQELYLSKLVIIYKLQDEIEDSIESHEFELSNLVIDCNQSNVDTSEALDKQEMDAIAQLASLDHQKHRFQRRLDRPLFSGPEGGQVAWSSAVLERNALQSELLKLDNEIKFIEQALSILSEKINFSNQIIGLPDNNRTTIDRDLESTQLAESDAAEKLRLARTHLLSVREKIEFSDILIASSRARKATFIQQQKTLEDNLRVNLVEWVSLGFRTEDFSIEALNQMIKASTAQLAELTRIETQIVDVRKSFSNWLNQNTYAQTLKALAKESDIDYQDGRDTIRSAAMKIQSDCILESKKLLRAKQIAQKSYTKVRSEVSTFNQRYLQPLNELMLKLNRTILTNPDVGLELFYTGKGVAQNARTQDGTPQHVSTLSPHLVHSEGQMAALAVSMLCAASMTFDWSRWSAMIMDDPLQHNDVVHASAFIDLIRNLVLYKNYQIFISTHDTGQAEFLQRKFSVSGIPFTSLQLLGNGQFDLKKVAGRNQFSMATSVA